jgi:hypothetical protein
VVSKYTNCDPLGTCCFGRCWRLRSRARNLGVGELRDSVCILRFEFRVVERGIPSGCPTRQHTPVYTVSFDRLWEDYQWLRRLLPGLSFYRCLIDTPAAFTLHYVQSSVSTSPLTSILLLPIQSLAPREFIRVHSIELVTYFGVGCLITGVGIGGWCFFLRFTVIHPKDSTSSEVLSSSLYTYLCQI